MTPKRTVALAMIGCAVVITLDAVVTQHTAPKPSAYAATGVLWVVLGFAADSSRPQLAVILAEAVFLGLFLNKGPGFLPRVKVPAAGTNTPAGAVPAPGHQHDRHRGGGSK